MPTNRTKRTRKFRSTTISDAMLYFLQTGDYKVRGRFPDMDLKEMVEIFQYGNPSCRERVRNVWIRHREEVLKNWKLKKKEGLPWAAVLFDNE